ncbi:VQ motif-containing protein 9 [Carica papaya]|uniref:VQ motif-containing protein 9 n=1 Tax=Carica papaya TaxID=3649 RepID=UPI000B8C7D43|nr:VQ motif-containing protein 9 [Carica papaya]
MDKSCHSSGESTITTNTGAAATSSSSINNSRDHYLKQLNKFSHKISKSTTTIIKKPPFDQPQNLNINTHHQVHHHHQAPPPPQLVQASASVSLPPAQNQGPSNLQVQQQQQQQHQPPVYNINKNDFRDVVQKLTGSPAHERFSNPPPIHPPKPQSSRLQRIRPPPLAHVSNRPPQLLNCANPVIPSHAPGALNPSLPIHMGAANATAGFIQRPPAPLSPLPPLPAVHAAAESPVSAYMRYLQSSVSNTDSNPKQFSGFSPLAPLVSPRWNSSAPPQQPQQHQNTIAPQPMPPSTSSGMLPLQPQFQLPPSPLPFGCLNSPRSPYTLLSPSLLLSPSSGQLGFPLSPTLPVPSPRWRGL